MGIRLSLYLVSPRYLIYFFLLPIVTIIISKHTEKKKEEENNGENTFKKKVIQIQKRIAQGKKVFGFGWILINY